MQNYTRTADTQKKRGGGLNFKNAKRNQTKIQKQNMHILIVIWVLLQGPQQQAHI